MSWLRKKEKAQNLLLENTKELIPMNSSDEDFDFVAFAYEKMAPRFEKGITLREDRRVVGLLFSMPKDDSRRLLRSMVKRFPEIRIDQR